jgi:serine/threonine protein kinase
MTTTSPFTGTERYLARELIVGSEEVSPTTASDIYAVGCIGLEVRSSAAVAAAHLLLR